MLELDAEEYGFRSLVDGSTLSIEINGYKVSSELDLFFAFSIGDWRFFRFAIDFDGNLSMTGSDNGGLYIYPSCSSTSKLESYGNPSNILINSSSIRDALAANDSSNWDQLSSTPNGNNNFPIKFEFINNDYGDPDSDSFIIRVSSPTFPNGLECQYGPWLYASVSTNENFKLYMTPDINTNNNQSVMIESFEIVSSLTGYNYNDGVLINPLNVDNDPYIIVIQNDTRNISGIVPNRIRYKSDEWHNGYEWYLRSGWGTGLATDYLYDWSLKMTLAAEKYAFKQGLDNSHLTIEVDGGKDYWFGRFYFGFSIGNSQYITFKICVGCSESYQVYIYPSCGSSAIANGDVSTLINPWGLIYGATTQFQAVDVDLTGGDYGAGDNSNWQNWVTRDTSGRAEPFRFEFINDDISNTFTFKFQSKDFDSPKVCTYNSAVTTGQDFKFFIAPDWPNSKYGYHQYRVYNFMIYYTYPGQTSDPTMEPTNNPIQVTEDPTNDPTIEPTDDPSSDPTQSPSDQPTLDPTINPTDDPTTDPSVNPTADPTTANPTNNPTTSDPTEKPSDAPCMYSLFLSSHSIIIITFVFCNV